MALAVHSLTAKDCIMTVLDVMAHELYLQLDARHITVSIETCKDIIEAVVSTTAERSRT